MNLNEKAVLYTKLIEKSMKESPSFTTDLDLYGSSFRYNKSTPEVIKYLALEGGSLFDRYNPDVEVKNSGVDPVFKTGRIQYVREFRERIPRELDWESGGLAADQEVVSHLIGIAKREKDIARLAYIGANAENQQEVALTEKNAFTEISKAISKARSQRSRRFAYDPRDFICYVSETTYELIKSHLLTVSRREIAGDGKAIETEIEVINGVKVVVVVDDFMISDIDISGQGFRPSDDSKQIDFIVMPKDAVAVPVVVNDVKIFENDAFAMHDTVIGGIIRHGVFVIETEGKGDAIVVNTSALKEAETKASK